MTVQELIIELEAVADKTKEVFFVNFSDFIYGVSEVIENSRSVYLVEEEE